MKKPKQILPEMYLKKLDLCIVLVDHLQKTKKESKNLIKKGDSRYIYQNELDKACFQHDMVYRDLKDLTRRTAPDKILHCKAFNIAENPKHDGY